MKTRPSRSISSARASLTACPTEMSLPFGLVEKSALEQRARRRARMYASVRAESAGSGEASADRTAAATTAAASCLTASISSGDTPLRDKEGRKPLDRALFLISLLFLGAPVALRLALHVPVPAVGHELHQARFLVPPNLLDDGADLLEDLPHVVSVGPDRLDIVGGGPLIYFGLRPSGAPRR